MNDETILAIAGIAGLTALGIFSCAFKECLEISALVAGISALAGAGVAYKYASVKAESKAAALAVK
jgi:hypothetical protein